VAGIAGDHGPVLAPPERESGPTRCGPGRCCAPRLSADASEFEPDARLTVRWLWTLRIGDAGPASNGIIRRRHDARVRFPGRTIKGALVWCVADAPGSLREEAKKVLAWEEIRDEEADRFDESPKRQMAESLKTAGRDLREAVWRSYKYVLVIGKDNELKTIDLGLVHSSAADSLVALILNRLRSDGEVETDLSSSFLVRNWPPAVPERQRAGLDPPGILPAPQARRHLREDQAPGGVVDPGRDDTRIAQDETKRVHREVCSALSPWRA
jgi:hypothetical protein